MKSTQCATCNKNVTSRNHLFSHLRETGHVLEPANKVADLNATKTAKCSVCSEYFPSRNKLFLHLKESGHGESAKSSKSSGSTNIETQSPEGLLDEFEEFESSSNDLSKKNLSVVGGNEAYFEYYLRQKICSRVFSNNCVSSSRDSDSNAEMNADKAGEEEWKKAYEKLRTPLPISYRIQESSWTGSNFCARLLNMAENLSDDFEDNTNADREKNAKRFQHWDLMPNENDNGNHSENLPKIRITIMNKTSRNGKRSSGSSSSCKEGIVGNGGIESNNQMEIYTENVEVDGDEASESDNVPSASYENKAVQGNLRNTKKRKHTDQPKFDKGEIHSSLLIALQELGAIHRQELVSAIPPLVLWSCQVEDISREDKAKEPSSSTVCEMKVDNDADEATDCDKSSTIQTPISKIRRTPSTKPNEAMIMADVCAAPGSKSLQLLDMLHMSAKEGNRDKNSIENIIPNGLLVVNDSDRSRIVTLCQRTRRVPRSAMLAINTDARNFPGMRRRCKNSGNFISNDRETNAPAAGQMKANLRASEKAGYKQKYDKVLCDVPCSADGTTRKNKQVWKNWSIPHAMSLHKLQRKILRRSMELLRPGGVLVYSTCSLNPLENEAVVASVIEDLGGIESMEIVPLPGWLVDKCHIWHGLSTWMVPNYTFGKGKKVPEGDSIANSDEKSRLNQSDDNASENWTMYKSYDDVPWIEQDHRGKDPNSKKTKGGAIQESMFPPKDLKVAQQLQNCGRFLPSSALDSGGFFVACIRRLRVGDLSTNAGDNEDRNGTGPVASLESIETKKTCKPFDTTADEQNQNDISSSTGNGQNNVRLAANDRCLREGDWICRRCDELNFGRRSRCFGCKVKKPRSLCGDGKWDKDVSLKAENASVLPLLEEVHKRVPNDCGSKPPKEESNDILTQFLNYFGITSFPMQNIRLMRRSNQQTLVFVSDAIANLTISNEWKPIRELGISLASSDVNEATAETSTDLQHNTKEPSFTPIFRLIDEGVPLLAKYATRHHLKLDPVDFRRALAQSVRNPSTLASEAEVERVQATLDRSLSVEYLCGSSMWFESISCMGWKEGCFLVSCECPMPSSKNSNSNFECQGLEPKCDEIGKFSLSCSIDSSGAVRVHTSLRIIAAMLVAVHHYIEMLVKITSTTRGTDIPSKKTK